MARYHTASYIALISRCSDDDYTTTHSLIERGLEGTFNLI
jgi:hypothetical protein